MRTALYTLIILLLVASVFWAQDAPQTRPGTQTKPAKPETGETTGIDRSGLERVETENKDIGMMINAQLDNGLKVVIQQMETTEVVSVRAYVKIGSMYEDEWLGHGISHYCEHIVSGGSTNKRTEEQFKDIMRKIGGDSNAYTYYDQTCYHITTIRPFAKTAIDLIGDWLSGCIIKESEFEREKGVIIQEVKKGLTEPGRVFSKFFMSSMFPDHPMGVPVIGYPELVEKVSREMMMEFYNRYYCPNNTVLAIAGGLDPAKTLEWVKESFGKWERKPLAPATIPDAPRINATKHVWESSRLMGGNTALLRIAFHTVPLTHEDLYSLDALGDVLGDGPNSRLVLKLRDQMQLVKSIGAYSWTPHFGFGQFVVYATTEYDKLAATRDAIFSELASLRSFEVTDSELRTLKIRTKSQHIFGLQTAEQKAGSLAGNLMAAVGLDFDEQYLANIEKVGKKDMLECARRYLSENRALVVGFFADEAFQTDKTKDPFKLENKNEASVPVEQGVQMLTLDNGLKVIVRSVPGTKNIAASLYGHGGLRFETADNNGVFRLMTSLMTRGTKTKSAEKINAIFDELGGGFSGTSGNNTFGFELSLIADDGIYDNLAKGLETLLDVLQNPAFDKTEFEQMLDRTKFAVQRRDESWETEAIQMLREKYFGENPYSMYVLGSDASLGKMSIETIKDAYSRFVSPQNCVMAIVGDFDAINASRVVRGVMGGWEARKIDIADTDSPVKRDDKRIFVKQGDKQMVTICMGFNAPRYDQLKDRAAMRLIDAITSGLNIPSGWLHEALRGGDKRFVYYVHAMTFHGIDAGMFFILTQCSPDDKDEVIGIIRREMARIFKEVSDEELADAKTMALTIDAIAMETNSNKASDHALNELYGLGYAAWQKERETIESITKADILECARKYLAGNETLVVIEPR